MISTLASPTPWIRLRARLGALAIDRVIAARGVRWDEPVEAARGRRLLSRRTRRDLAAGLTRLLADAARPRGLSPAAPVPAGTVLACATEIHALADALRGPGPVHPAGVARARLLLVDPASVLYAAGSRRRVRSELSAAAVALSPATWAPDAGRVVAHRRPGVSVRPDGGERG